MSFANPSPNPTSPLKPSPLGLSHSPRASPFRRQNSSASPSNSTSNSTSSSSNNAGPGVNAAAAALRPTTPTNNSNSTRPATPSKLHAASTPSHDATTFSPRHLASSASPTKPSAVPASPRSPRTVRGPPSPNPSASTPHYRGASAAPSPVSNAANLDALARLPAPLVRALRDAFSLLDRDSTGALTPADVAAMHAQLGLPPPTAGELAAYFPPGAPTPRALPAFLGGLAGPLARMDRADDLLAALGAFDEGEAGTVGVDALLGAVCAEGGGMPREVAQGTVMKGFTGRGRLARNAGGGVGAGGGSSGGEVFRYREWVANLGAGGEGRERQAVEG